MKNSMSGKGALKIMRKDMAARLVSSTELGFVMMCMVILASRNFALDITALLMWLVLATVTAGYWIFENHALKSSSAVSK